MTTQQVLDPVIAILGRPNVGKSTLFNRITRTRDALVANDPGLTRDRKVGKAYLHKRACLLIDTGGIFENDCALSRLIKQQALIAAREADAILLVVDGRSGLLSTDPASKGEKGPDIDLDREWQG